MWFAFVSIIIKKTSLKVHKHFVNVKTLFLGIIFHRRQPKIIVCALSCELTDYHFDELFQLNSKYVVIGIHVVMFLI